MIEIKLRPLDHCEWEVGGIFLKREIIDWLVENDISYAFYFGEAKLYIGDNRGKETVLELVVAVHSEEDAVLFKLRWI
jgi:hypothetical protein